jgi:hypothetical protein
MIKLVSGFLSLIILTFLAVVYGDINLSRIFNSKEAGKTIFIAIDSKHKPGKLTYASVKPILDKRCVTCHSGLDAPCQLQLGSYEGLQRGSTKQAVYQHRLHAITPTRLTVDGKTPGDWRSKGFFPVLNEKSQFPEINLNNSLAAKMLALKRENSVSGGETPANRNPECPSLEEFASFAQAHPSAGMPYNLPGLDKGELEKLLNWLQDGAKNSPSIAVSDTALTEINKWEQFFNDPAPSVQLATRYVYEHIFSGHLHFKGQPVTEFYQLVRSKTASGQAIEELDTVHPYTTPAAKPFYYRLRPVTETLVDKNHAVYELSDAKMARIKALFLNPNVAVTTTPMPAYPQQQSAQPFSTFKALPPEARYQFLLDDAAFFFAAMIKSPALNQHDGLSGLRDHVWVAFLKPRPDVGPQTTEFLNINNPYLRLPTSANDSAGLSEWFELKSLQKQYLANKDTFTKTVLLNNQTLDESILWTGDDNDSNTLLTVFRHDDNASVVKNLQGDTPTTAWVIDYPLFERLHYLLLAGFNPYGDMIHHLNTRLVLDLLRSEAENNFLAFLPKPARQPVHESWYPSLDSQWLGVFNTPDVASQAESAIAYQSQAYAQELFGKLVKKPSQTTMPTVCPQAPCTSPEPPTPSTLPPQYDNFARQLAELKGLEISALSEVSFLRIKTSTPESDPVYTLIRNRQLKHVGVLFGENQRRQPEQDTLTVLPGLVGSYPNQFFTPNSDQLEAFITQLKQANTEAAKTQFIGTFGISRQHPQFWSIYDNFNQKHHDGQPDHAGIFDLSRYGKR